MWKQNRTRAEQQFAAGQKRDQTLIKQKEKTQRERDERMARLRDQRLAKEAAEQAAAGQPEDAGHATVPDTAVQVEATGDAQPCAPRLPRVHPHRS